MSPLNVYKASAGSGKTFALTLEYLTLLFRYPGIHRHILAVTFTNKAAGEMKLRILDRLHQLSIYDGKKQLEEMNKLVEATGMDINTISRRAGELLKTILIDYSWFSVGTIDRFFQSVIRAFTREIGIQPGYNLELDHNRILSLAVDRLFQDLADREGLQRWLIRFAEERLESERSWNFRNDMIDLGMELFREAFQDLFLEQDLSALDRENLDRYHMDLDRVEKETRDSMSQTGQTALDHLLQSGYGIEAFRQKGSSPPALFLDAREGRNLNFTPTRLDALVQPEKWLNKGAPEEMAQLTEDLLMPLLKRLYDQHMILNSITLIRQNFYTLGILGDIREQVRSYTRERNLFLISDSNRFLRGIIGSNQVPFIYERTGSRFSHIMLDEFQDTSLFQYDNFKPLIDNALAQGHSSLVVGDVKQSIYRWRNSDWKILASDLESDFRHQGYHVHRLARNHRSHEQVIRFNNTLFQLASSELENVIERELSGSTLSESETGNEVLHFRNAYADAVQEIPDDRLGTGGMVKVELFEAGEDHSFSDQVLSRIPEWIDEIRQSGIEPGEIAILVRNRREGVEIANRLLEQSGNPADGHGLRLISNESLLLVQNTSVTTLLAVLRYMVNPGDDLNKALLKYHCYLLGISNHRVLESVFDTSLSMELFLPAGFPGSLHQLKQLPLYELVESLIGLFGLDKRAVDLPYLQALQDMIIDIHRREPHGIAEFLHYWEQHGSSKAVAVSEESNAIRILTIHKAKGLEFKAVIVPFCNWEITTGQKRSSILWCSTAGTPFDKLPVIPVRFSSRMLHTAFSRAYYMERVKGYMDNLNLMYVALTRAKEALFIGIPLEEGDKLRNTGDLFRAIMDRRATAQPALGSLADFRTGNTITVGTLPVRKETAGKEDPWQFTTYPVNRGNIMPRVRTRNDAYFVDEEGIFRTGQMYGNMMHRVFSGITTAGDVGPMLDSLQKKGLVPAKDRKGLEEQIEGMISRPGVAQWFSDGENRTVYNERNLMSGDGRLLRPDRVVVQGDLATVVDFKFGEMEKGFHIDQVRNYMDHLVIMGYERVEGFVWYVILDRIIKVEKR